MYIKLSRPLSCHFLITSGLFRVGWIPLWGAHRWRVINHRIKQNLLLQAKGTALCKYLMILPTYSWNPSEFFSSILGPILVERGYHKVKWPLHKPWILMWDQSFLPHFLNKVTKSPEPMIRMILPCYFFTSMLFVSTRKRYIHNHQPTNILLENDRQLFLSTQLFQGFDARSTAF